MMPLRTMAATSRGEVKKGSQLLLKQKAKHSGWNGGDDDEPC